MKWVMTGLITAFCFLVLSAMKGTESSDYAVKTINTFKQDAQQFARSAVALKETVTAIRARDSLSVARAKAALMVCRNEYKKIEFFMEYFFDYPVNLYNRAPVFEVEEPYMEYQTPVGLQVVEDLLMDE